MTQQPWTNRELRLLSDHATKGAHAIAQLTGRSVASIRAAAHRHRISLRTHAERRGKVLGEPRAAAHHPDARSAILNRDIDSARYDYHLTQAAARRRGDPAEVCPACGIRSVEMPSTGLCRTCHKHAAVEAYRHASEERTAERAVVSERQRRHRAQEDEDADN